MHEIVCMFAIEGLVVKTSFNGCRNVLTLFVKSQQQFEQMLANGIIMYKRVCNGQACVGAYIQVCTSLLNKKKLPRMMFIIRLCVCLTHVYRVIDVDHSRRLNLRCHYRSLSLSMCIYIYYVSDAIQFDWLAINAFECIMQRIHKVIAVGHGKTVRSFERVT